MKRLIILLAFAGLYAGTIAAKTDCSYGPVGFVNCDGGITGGMDGQIVRVKDRNAFEKAVGDDEPRVVIVEGTLTGAGIGRKKDAVEVGSNKTILGAGDNATLYGIGLNINSKNNIIIRNITIFDGSPDAIACRDSHHIWVDHCDLGSEHDNEREDWDGLLDFTIGSNFLTASCNRFHDHDKVSICNSGTQHFEDNGKMKVTYHHNIFQNTTQRNPRVGYGRGHVFNNYYDSISGYGIGAHSRAKILSENNYFTKAVKRPFNQMYSDDSTNAYFGELADSGSYFGKPVDKAGKHRLTGTDFSPKYYYDYYFVVNDALALPQLLADCAGPQAGIEREPILYPGNGAIGIDCKTKLRYSPLEDVKSVIVYIGTSPDNMKLLPPTFDGHYELLPATTYYWKVIAKFVDGTTAMSPLYRFTTAAACVSNPIPRNGDDNVKLYEAVAVDAFCSPLTLKWSPAFDASEYNVYIGSENDSLKFVGSTDKTEFFIEKLSAGKAYCWRVDAIMRDGSVVDGKLWRFSSPISYLKEGRNETESMALSGIAFTEDGSWFSASEGLVTVGDEGPGALTGVWGGEDATECRLSVTFYNEQKGAATIALSVNGQMIDKWVASEAVNELTTHEIAQVVRLNRGDEVRVDFITEGKMRCRIDYITITALK